MSEQLTIRELFAYLAYDVKIQWNESKEIWGISYWETDYTNNKYSLSTLVFTIGKQNEEPLGWSLLLRPLSDLTNLSPDGKHWIEVHAEYLDSNCDAYREWIEAFIGGMPQDRKSIILQAPYTLIQELLEQHYDIFSLIPKGLALPIKK